MILVGLNSKTPVNVQYSYNPWKGFCEMSNGADEPVQIRTIRPAFDCAYVSLFYYAVRVRTHYAI